MRKLLAKQKVQADSLWEIRDLLIATANRIGRTHGVRFGANRPSLLRGGPLLNALILWFAELPVQEQDRIALPAISRLKLFLCETEDEMKKLQPERHDPAASLMLPATGAVLGRPKPTPPTPRRRRKE